MRATGVYIRSVFPRQLFLFHFQTIQLVLFPVKIENFVRNYGVLTDSQSMKEVRQQTKNRNDDFEPNHFFTSKIERIIR